MDRAFRLALRVALALTLLTGVGLVIYSLREGEPGREGPPEVGRSEPAITPTAEGTSVPEQEEAAGTEGTPERETRPASETESVIVGFSQVIRDASGGMSQAEISGPQAVMDRETNVAQILEPLLVARLVSEGESGEAEAQVEEVRVTAASGTLDLGQGLAQLTGGVLAVGKNLEISTDHVTYRSQSDSLSSDTDVTIHRTKTDSTGNQRTAMSVTGNGLQVDLTLRKLTLASKVKVNLFDVSQDFLAGESLEVSSPTAAGEVVITCDGKLIYENLARKVTFSDNVVATFGPKTLEAEELVIQLDEKEGKDELTVTDIVAKKDVCLTYRDQVLRGDSLVWRNITQTGILTGQPATIQTREFDLSGGELTLYMLNDHFHAEGPGDLLWKAPHEAEEQPAQPASEETLSAGPLKLTSDAPIRITWQESMRYDVPDNEASFVGQTVVEQDENSLTCQQIIVNFNEGTGEVSKIDAQGQVGIRDKLTGTVREALCEKLVWDAQMQTIELTAAEGKEVTITAGTRTIVAPQVIFDGAAEALKCPAAGRLKVTADKAPRTDGSSPGPPIQVNWQKNMQFLQQPEPVATFEGSAVARRGDYMIEGEVLRVDFDRKMSPIKISATGDAVVEVVSADETPPAEGDSGSQGEEPTALNAVGLTGKHWRLECSEVVIQVEEQIMHSSTAGTLVVFEKDAPSGTMSWDSKMQLDLTDLYARFEGSVVARVPAAEMASNTLRLDFDETGQLRHGSAEGDVRFTAAGEGGWLLTAASAEAIFGQASSLQQFIARGGVEIADAHRRLRAARVQLFLQEAEDQSQPVIYRAVAEDEVWLQYQQKDTVEAGGDRLEWNQTTERYVLTGEPYAYVRHGVMIVNESPTIILDRPTGRMVESAGGARAASEAAPGDQ